LSAENSGKHLGGRGSAPNPAGEHTALPQIPIAGGERVAAPSQEPTQAFGLRPCPQWKILGTPLGLRCFHLLLHCTSTEDSIRWARAKLQHMQFQLIRLCDEMVISFSYMNNISMHSHL